MTFLDLECPTLAYNTTIARISSISTTHRSVVLSLLIAIAGTQAWASQCNRLARLRILWNPRLLFHAPYFGMTPFEL